MIPANKSQNLKISTKLLISHNHQKKTKKPSTECIKGVIHKTFKIRVSS